MGFPPNGGKRKVPAGPKEQPGRAAKGRKQGQAAGVQPGKPGYGIKNTSRKHSSAVTGASRNTPSGQGLLSGKAKRQVQ